MQRTKRIVVVGYHHISVVADSQRNAVYDTVDEVQFCFYWMNHKGRGKASVDRKCKAVDFLDLAVNGPFYKEQVLVIVPNLSLFLCCCGFANWLERSGYRFKTTKCHTKLASQEYHSWYDYDFFVKAGDTCIVSLANRKTENSLTLLDFGNFGLVQYKDDVTELWPELEGQIMHQYIANDRDGLNRSSLVMSKAWVDTLLEIQDQCGVSDFSYTLGGLAKKINRKLGGNKHVTEHDEEAALSLERQASYGGRMEAFGCGKWQAKAYCLDISSCYPYICQTLPLPCSLLSTSIGITIHGAKLALQDKFGIARVLLRDGGRRFPKRLPNFCAYSEGSFYTVLCGIELSQALTEDNVLDIPILCTYEQGYPLKDFEDKMLELRLQYRNNGNRIAEKISKLLANCLIGKCSQSGTSWEPLHDEIVTEPFGFYWKYDEETRENIEVRVINWHAERAVRGLEIKGTFPAIYAAVCGYGRKIITDLAFNAGLDNVLLICVDGMIVSEAGWKQIAHLCTTDKKEFGKPHLQAIHDGITVVSSTCWAANEVAKMSGQVDSSYPTPANPLLAMVADDNDKACQDNNLRLVRRRGIAIDLESTLQEYSTREWTRYPSIVLNEKKLTFEEALLLPEKRNKQ